MMNGLRERRLLLAIVLLVAAGCTSKRPPVPLYYTAERELRQGNYYEAIDSYRIFLADSGPRGQSYVPRSYYMLAVAYFRTEQYAEALATLDELELVRPGYIAVQTWALRGDVEHAMGDDTTAVRSWDQAWRIAGPLDRQRLQHRVEASLKEMSLEELRKTEAEVNEPALHQMIAEEIVAKGGSVIEDLDATGAPAPDTVALGGVDETAAAEPLAEEETSAAGRRGILDRWRGGEKSAAGAPAPAQQPIDEGMIPLDESPAAEAGEAVEAPAAGRVAFLAALSGPAPEDSSRVFTAVKLAFGDRAESVIPIDVGTSPATVSEAWKAVRDDARILAVIAWADNPTAATLASLARTSSVPVLLLSSQTVLDSPYVVRKGMTRAEEVARLVEYMSQTVRMERFGIVRPNTTDGKLYADLFASEVKRRGGRIVGSIVYQPGQGSWNEELARMSGWRQRDVNVEAIYVPDASLSSQSLTLAINTKFPDVILLGVEGWNRPELPSEAPWLRAFVADSFYAASSQPGPREFAELFEATTGRAPTSTEAEAYDAAAIVAAGVNEGAENRTDMRAWIETADATTAHVTASPPLVLRISQGKVESTTPPPATTSVWLD